MRALEERNEQRRMKPKDKGGNIKRDNTNIHNFYISQMGFMKTKCFEETANSTWGDYLRWLVCKSFVMDVYTNTECSFLHTAQIFVTS